MDRIGMGRLRQQSACEVLQADPNGSETISPRGAELGATRGRNHEGSACELRGDTKTMSRVKATVRSFHAWQHADEIAAEVEEELRFHVQMRMKANIEKGMTPNEAQLAARQSFGDFDRVKVNCCEIKRGFPFNLKALRMALYIAIACLAGGFALVA